MIGHSKVCRKILGKMEEKLKKFIQNRSNKTNLRVKYFVKIWGKFGGNLRKIFNKFQKSTREILENIFDEGKSIKF